MDDLRNDQQDDRFGGNGVTDKTMMSYTFPSVPSEVHKQTEITDISNKKMK